MVKLTKNFLYYFYYCQKNEEILDQKDKEKYSVILNRDIPLNLTFVTVTQLFLPDLKSKLKTLENMTACFFQKSG